MNPDVEHSIRSQHAGSLSEHVEIADRSTPTTSTLSELCLTQAERTAKRFSCSCRPRQQRPHTLVCEHSQPLE
jgi:hypothetical protein